MKAFLVILCLLFSVCYCRIDSQRVVNHNRETQVLDDYAADLEVCLLIFGSLIFTLMLD